MDKKNFCNSCSEFIDKAVPLVLEAQKRVYLSQKRKATYNADESISIVNVPDYVRFVFTIEDDIKTLSEFKNLLGFILTNSKFPGTRSDFEPIVLLVLGRFLEIISSQQGMIRKELRSRNFGALNKIVQDLKDYLRRDYLEIVHRLPLMYFTSNSDQIRIANNFVIRKITKEDREDFSLQFPEGSFLDSDTYEYLVELVRKVKRTHIDPHHQEPPSMDLTAPIITQLASSLITSLRVIEGKYVDYRYMISEYKTKFLGSKGLLDRKIYVINVPEMKCQIDRDKSLKLRKLRRHIYSVENNSILLYSRLKLALNRYNNSYERKSIADKVIDLAIVFEILYSKENDKTDSINFKLKARAAKFLGSNFENRRNIAKTVGDFYSIRSALVHGGKSDLNTTDMKVVQRANNLLRESLLLYIDKIFRVKSSSQFDHNSFIEFIDYN